MELSEEYLMDFLTQAGGPTADGLKKMLLFADTMPEFESDEAWKILCEFALAVDATYGVTANYTEHFLAGHGAASAMQDNYVLAALAACKIDWKDPEPLMAYAAYNKHDFPGFAPHGVSEISCMRVLHWGGWDIDAALPESGKTALHHMVYLRYKPGSHPKAVAWLLERGADVNARTVGGDTPLILLCGCDTWLPAMTETFKLLLLAGADPLDSVADGTSALSLLQQAQTYRANSARAELISAVEADVKRSKGFFTSMFKIKPEEKWKNTFTLNHAHPVMQMTA